MFKKLATNHKEILNRITQKKQKLDVLRPLPKELEKNLYDWFKVALTYSSNAIEGNTLSLAQTAQVVEKQLTIDGKTVTEHLEALNHAQAIDFIKKLAQEKKKLTEKDILAIHKIILQKINDDQIDELITDINKNNDHVVMRAAQTNLKLSGRAARLFMNLLLMQDGYPLVIIDAKKRSAYINAIQKALQGDASDYYQFIYEAVEHSLDEYLQAIQESE